MPSGVAAVALCGVGVGVCGVCAVWVCMCAAFVQLRWVENCYAHRIFGVAQLSCLASA